MALGLLSSSCELDLCRTSSLPSGCTSAIHASCARLATKRNLSLKKLKLYQGRWSQVAPIRPHKVGDRLYICLHKLLQRHSQMLRVLVVVGTAEARRFAHSQGQPPVEGS